MTLREICIKIHEKENKIYFQTAKRPTMLFISRNYYEIIICDNQYYTVYTPVITRAEARIMGYSYYTVLEDNVIELI